MTSNYYQRRYRDRTLAAYCPTCQALPGQPCVGRTNVHTWRATAARRIAYKQSQDWRSGVTRLKFPTMVDVVPEGTHDDISITHFDVSEEASKFTGLRAAIKGRMDEYVPAGRYARLTVRGTLMMTDTPMEQRSNFEVVSQARGDVLIGGLGLGMITVPVLRKPEVTSVTIIEKEPGVIALVEPAIRAFVTKREAKKLTVLPGDILTWRPAKRGRQFDTIYFDIWPDISYGNTEDIKTLRRAFARYLRPGGWSRCWKEQELRG